MGSTTTALTRRVRVRTASGIRDVAAPELLTFPALPGFEVTVESFFGQ